MKPLLLSATLLGLLWPTAAHSITHAATSETTSNVATSVAQTAAEPVATGLNIETRLEPQADGTTEGEITFNGNANEVVVVMISREDDRFPSLEVAALYTASGETISPQRNYPDYMTFDQSSGNTRTFLLPETGEYRLVLESSHYRRDEPSVSQADYLVKVRNATYYERLLMSVETFVDDGDYDAAFSRLALAVDDSPNLPAAYLYRVFAYAGMLYETPEFETRIESLYLDNYEDENYLDSDDSIDQYASALFSLIHDTFLTLPTEDQAIVMSDLRQLNGIYISAIANGEFEPTEDIFGGESPFIGIAEFLETGMPTNIIEQIFFGVDVVAEPNIVAEPNTEVESPTETVEEPMSEEASPVQTPESP